MNRSLKVFALLLFGHAALCQHLTTDREKMSLRDRVQQLSLVSYELSPGISGHSEKKILTDSIDYAFNEAGNLSRKNEHYIYGYQGDEFNYAYDKDGKLLYEQRLAANAVEPGEVMEFRFIYSYDSSGKLVGGYDWVTEGSQPAKEVYTYDEKGNLAGEQFYEKNGELDREHIYQYDQNGRQKLVAYIYTNPARRNEWTNHYDRKGNLSEQNYFSAPGVLDQKTVFSYDDKKEVVEKKMYDAKGKLIKRISFRYVYDAKSNWISKTEYENEEPKRISERTIIYER